MSLSLRVYKDEWTKATQVSLDTKDDGYRLLGPKFNGSSSLVASQELTLADAREMRRMLDEAFPINP